MTEKEPDADVYKEDNSDEKLYKTFFVSQPMAMGKSGGNMPFKWPSPPPLPDAIKAVLEEKGVSMSTAEDNQKIAIQIMRDKLPMFITRSVEVTLAWADGQYANGNTPEALVYSILSRTVSGTSALTITEAIMAGAGKPFNPQNCEQVGLFYVRRLVVVPTRSYEAHNYPLDKPCAFSHDMSFMRMTGSIGNNLYPKRWVIRPATEDEIEKFYTHLAKNHPEVLLNLLARWDNND